MQDEHLGNKPLILAKAKDEDSCPASVAIQSYKTDFIYDTRNKLADGFCVLLITSSDIQSASNSFNPTEGT